MGDVEDTRRRWENAFKQALEYDTWGQVEEATEGYLKLSNAISNEATENVLGLPFEARADLKKMAACLQLRIKELQTGTDKGIGVNSMKKLSTYYKGFMVKKDPFPLQVSEEVLSPAISSVGEDINEVEGGTLLPPMQSARRGDELLRIRIDKWGFKEATGFIDPYLTVQVVNQKGELLESAQDTPITNRVKPNYVMFGQAVHIQTPLNALPDGAAIVFEFKHCKPKKKKKVSTRAWCFMEMEEVSAGPLALEIYKKPTDLKRKKIALLSVKELYLHLELSISRVP
mmetsp:Transcript_245/g.414  ORF Transcript_245/g.414 Transcript_245/m.414 type:complete len:286 (-) Transcript_245:11-868(-)